MRFVFISDTHSMHRKMAYPVPDGDVLVHCGDLTGRGRIQEIGSVAKWMGEHPHRYKIAIAGNHDACAEYDPSLTAMTFSQENVIYLCERTLNLEGLLLYGAPWTPNFCNWHFMPPRHSEALALKWDRIPEHTEILVTHGPPHGILDAYVEPGYIAEAGQEHAGCELLRMRIEALPDLKLHAFGHIHEGWGTDERVLDNGNKVKFVNAAICTRGYQPTNPPIVVDV